MNRRDRAMYNLGYLKAIRDMVDEFVLTEKPVTRESVISFIRKMNHNAGDELQSDS